MVKEHIKEVSGRREDSHKGDYGRVLVLGGSPGMTGAAYLCSQAALRAGSGLVTCGLPKSLNGIMEVKLTEAMTLPLEETKPGFLSLKAKSRILDFAAGCDCVAIGPGLGSDAETRTLVKELLEAVTAPVVLDADGINALEGDTGVLTARKHVTVVTPHPGEMARLTGRDAAEIQADRTAAAREFANATGTVICLKGHRTVVADPEGNIYVNETGNSGMATGGTGDVLTGMVASFIGQGINARSAVVSAVYLHGLAGDIAAEKKGQFGMIASDLLEYMPEAFAKAGI